MSNDQNNPPQKTDTAVKVAWIAASATLLAALLGAAATLGASKLQSEEVKPATPSPASGGGESRSVQPDAPVSSPTPAPSEPPSDRPSASRDSSAVMVKDLVPLDESPWDVVTANVDGESYSDSLRPSNCSIVQTSEQTYVIGKDYKRFQSKIGVDDYSERASPVYFRIVGDGNVLYNRRVGPGRPGVVDVPVSGIVRLTLRIKIDDYDSDCDETLAMWIDARLER